MNGVIIVLKLHPSSRRKFSFPRYGPFEFEGLWLTFTFLSIFYDDISKTHNVV